MEEWKPLLELDSAYSISSLGRLRRDVPGRRTQAGKILQDCYDSDGYVVNRLTFNGRAVAVRRHQIVAKYFLGPCPVGHTVNHEDGVKSHNWVGNLNYKTPKHQQLHASEHQLLAFGDRNGTHRHPERIARGEKQGLSRLTEDQVREIKTHPEIYLDEFAERFKVHRTTIHGVRVGRTWRHIS